MLKNLVTNTRIAPALILVGLALVLGAADPRVLAPANLGTVVIVASPIILVALAAMIILVSGGIDLSAGISVTFCCIAVGTVITLTGSLAVALLAGLVAALLVGVINGLLIGMLKIPPFVATLSTMVILQGVTLYSARGGVLIVNNPVLKFIGQGVYVGVPLIVVFAGLAAILCAALLRQTGFGLRIYAVGSNLAAVELAGVRVTRQLMGTYVFSGFFIFLCSCALIGRVPIVTPTMGGTSLLLDALTAAVLGGVSIFGGSGTVLGLVCGALSVSLITTAIQIFGLDPSAIGLVKGGIIVVMLGIYRGLDWIGRPVRRPASAAG